MNHEILNQLDAEVLSKTKVLEEHREFLKFIPVTELIYILSFYAGSTKYALLLQQKDEHSPFEVTLL